VLQDTDQMLDQISAVVEAAPRDLETVERTLTDGYAQALALEAERYRIEKRLAEVAGNLAGGGNASAKARELTQLAGRLEGNSGDLTRLRGVLADLRRHADGLRA
jgi:hypothetical protein